MAQNLVSRGLLSFGETEELWAIEDERRRAESSFRRARRQARVRRIIEALGHGGRALKCEPGRAGETFDLELGAIAGLPTMPRRLAEAWRREFRRSSDEGELEPIALRWVAGRWRLAGGTRELLRVELLRARGAVSVRAAERPAAGLSLVPQSLVECAGPGPGRGDRRAS